MKIFDNQYHVLKFFVKPIVLQKIFLAHVDCLKTDTEDYNILAAKKNEKQTGLTPDEVIPLKDAQFDYEKVRAKFEKNNLMGPDEFDKMFSKNIDDGFLTKDMIPTQEGINLVTALQDEYHNSKEYLAIANKNT